MKIMLLLFLYLFTLEMVLQVWSHEKLQWMWIVLKIVQYKMWNRIFNTHFYCFFWDLNLRIKNYNWRLNVKEPNSSVYETMTILLQAVVSMGHILC